MTSAPRYRPYILIRRSSLPLLSILVSFIVTGTSIAQQDTSARKLHLHAGISALPVYDVLNLFPANVIKGYAVMGNVGCFVNSRLSLGFHPFYGEVSNTYTGFSQEPFGERQNMKIIGSNTTLRYYFHVRRSWMVYMMASAGFGVMEETITAVSTSQVIPGSRRSNAIATFLGGIGANYFITPNFAAEFNLPYGALYNFNAAPADKYFLTAVPMLGVQLYWN